MVSKFLKFSIFISSIGFAFWVNRNNPGASAPLMVSQTTANEIPNVIVIPGNRIRNNNSNDSSVNSIVTPQTNAIIDLAVNANPISITLYDNSTTDGDIVKVTVNGQSPLGLDRVVLKNTGQTFFIDLKRGLNTVAVTALNNGTSAPNTATLIIKPSQVILGSNVLEDNQPPGSTTYFTVAAPDILGNCVARDNLGETANSFISRCRKASIRLEFPSQLLSKTLGEIKNGSTATYRKAWKLLNDNRFKK